MWTWIFQIVLCIIILWTGHSLWNYFLDKFSKQKTRDLVNIHTEKYKSIINELTNKIQTQTQTQTQTQNNELSMNQIQTQEIQKEIQTELYTDLEQFINEISKTI